MQIPHLLHMQSRPPGSNACQTVEKARRQVCSKQLAQPQGPGTRYLWFLGPQNHQDYGFRNQKPKMLGTWTLWLRLILLLGLRAKSGRASNWSPDSGMVLGGPWYSARSIRGPIDHINIRISHSGSKAIKGGYQKPWF